MGTTTTHPPCYECGLKNHPGIYVEMFDNSDWIAVCPDCELSDEARALMDTEDGGEPQRDETNGWFAELRAEQQRKDGSQ